MKWTVTYSVDGELREQVVEAESDIAAWLVVEEQLIASGLPTHECGCCLHGSRVGFGGVTRAEAQP